MTKQKWNPLSNLGVFNKEFKKIRTKKTGQNFSLGEESDGENTYWKGLNGHQAAWEAKKIQRSPSYSNLSFGRFGDSKIVIHPHKKSIPLIWNISYAKLGNVKG